MNTNNFFAEINRLIREKFPNGIPFELRTKIIREIYAYPTNYIPLNDNRNEEMVAITRDRWNYSYPLQFIDLVKYLWKVDITITDITGIALPKNSVCIYFDTHSDLKKFMDILFMNTTSDKQSEMILNAFNKTYDDDWYYDIHLHIFIKKCSNLREKIQRIGSTLSVRFPISDYGWILKKIKKFHQSGKKYEKILRKLDHKRNDMERYTK